MKVHLQAEGGKCSELKTIGTTPQGEVEPVPENPAQTDAARKWT